MKCRLGLLAASAIAALSLASLPAQPVRLSDGKVYFTRPPSLIKASTTQNAAFVWGAIYYFVLNIPENAGEPLGSVAISADPSPDPVTFDLGHTYAFEGTRDRQAARLSLEPVAEAQKTGVITVTFNPPVPPGKTVTTALFPNHNPMGGVYLYGVTAFPAGGNPYGQFLGYGRIQIYDRGGLWPFW